MLSVQLCPNLSFTTKKPDLIVGVFGSEDKISVKLGWDRLWVASYVKLRLEGVDGRVIGEHRFEKSGVGLEIHERTDSDADTDVATFNLNSIPFF
jgi:hypothetical protein